MTQIPYESSYVKLLPSLFHETELEGKRPLIERYLRIFEKILSGIDDEELGGKKGLGDILDIAPELFHPRLSFLFEETNEDLWSPLGSPELEIIKKYFGSKNWNETQTIDFLDEFLTWLAGWMALVLKEDWGLEKKRKVVGKIIPIYRMRGTKKGIEEFLSTYVGEKVEILETLGTFQVGGSRLGINTIIAGRPHFFKVKVKREQVEKKTRVRTRFIKNLKSVLDSEKPVHTSYLLTIITPRMQISDQKRLQIGENTLIGGVYSEINV